MHVVPTQNGKVENMVKFGEWLAYQYWQNDLIRKKFTLQDFAWPFPSPPLPRRPTLHRPVPFFTFVHVYPPLPPHCRFLSFPPCFSFSLLFLFSPSPFPALPVLLFFQFLPFAYFMCVLCVAKVKYVGYVCFPLQLLHFPFLSILPSSSVFI